MHLLESYSLVTGMPISKGFIKEEEVELPKTQYITLHHNCLKAQARRYRKWQEVVEFLRLNKNFDYEIIEIGDGKNLTNTNIDYSKKLSINQLAYLIKNCSLHLGYDSFPIHLASHFQKKIVGIYNGYSKNSGPFFSKEEDIRILQAPFPEVEEFVNGKFIKSLGRICHSFVDELDMINRIDPTDVSNAVFELLNL